MANRILRDWTDSENIDKLSFPAEVLFTRLFMKADDFGCFHANPKLVKAALFPLRDARESDISRWMAECHDSGLIAFYNEGEKNYLFIKNFGQRLRTMKRRFPIPDGNTQTIVSNTPPETKLKLETETEIEGKINEILNSIIWIEQLSMKFKQTVSVTSDYLHEFLNELKLKDDLRKSIKEIKSHFINWLRIQKEKSFAKKEKNGNSASNDRIQRTNEVANTLAKVNSFLGIGEQTYTGPNSTEEGHAIVIENSKITGGGNGSGDPLQIDS